MDGTQTIEPFKVFGKVLGLFTAESRNSRVSNGTGWIRVIRGHGILDDHHAGTRLLDVREREMLSLGLPKGMEIANQREFTAISAEEMREIEQDLVLGGSIAPGSLSENLMLGNIPNLTRLPPGTRLFFQNNNVTRTAVLVVWGENEPCIGPGNVIQEQFPGQSDVASRFVKAAHGRRGVVGSVYSSGVIKVGDIVIAHVPLQRLYTAAR